jgi:hypothetical protein
LACTLSWRNRLSCRKNEGGQRNRKVETDPHVKIGTALNVNEFLIAVYGQRAFTRNAISFSDYPTCTELSGSHYHRAGATCGKEDHDGIKLSLSTFRSCW